METLSREESDLIKQKVEELRADQQRRERERDTSGVERGHIVQVGGGPNRRERRIAEAKAARGQVQGKSKRQARLDRHISGYRGDTYRRIIKEVKVKDAEGNIIATRQLHATKGWRQYAERG